MDITYIRLKQGLVYLCAVIDWHSRYVLSWRLSITLQSDFCIEALQEAIANYGLPEIFNTDQGVQFTSNNFIVVLQDRGIRISMDGKGRWVDNVLIERLWRSVKYEDVYLKEYPTVVALRHGIGVYFHFYNNERTHDSLGKCTPSEYYDGLREAA
jgi:putative transposase